MKRLLIAAAVALGAPAVAQAQEPCAELARTRLPHAEVTRAVEAKAGDVEVCQIIDQAIQMHGALGVSQHTPLARMYANTRTLRIADGPDEVHHMVVGRNELQQYREQPEDISSAAVFRN